MKSQIRLDMTRDGLRIQIVDEQNRPMFDSGSAVVKPYMRELLREIGHVLTGRAEPDHARRPHRRPAVRAAASAATATGSSRATAPTRRGARSSPAACPRTGCCWCRVWRRAMLFVPAEPGESDEPAHQHHRHEPRCRGPLAEAAAEPDRDRGRRGRRGASAGAAARAEVACACSSSTTSKTMTPRPAQPAARDGPRRRR